jgi:3-methyladenine DNA glycosylase AlkD
VPAIRAVAKSIGRRWPEISHDDLIALVVTLWSAPVHERRMAAVELLKLFVDSLDQDDVAVLEDMLRESKTWALSDVLAASVMGSLVERLDLGPTLDRWAVDDDFWMRRSALLVLLAGLIRGAGDFQRFSGYADSMLEEKEYFVRKAIGWVLRETARKRPVLVYEWLLPRVNRASGVTISEAIKPLSEQQRTSILAARS